MGIRYRNPAGIQVGSQLVYRATGINLKTTGETAIIPAVPFKYMVNDIFWRITNVTGATVRPTFSAGDNAGTSNNYYSATQLPAGTATDTFIKYNTALSAITLYGSNAFNANITVGATATTYTGDFYVLITVVD